MSEFLKKYGITLIIIFVLSIIISYLWFIVPFGLPTGDIEKENWLLFWGSFLTFFGTISLGFVAIWQNENANKTNTELVGLNKQANALNKQISDENSKLIKENDRRSVLPFLSINKYLTEYQGNIFSSLAAQALLSKTDADKETELIPVEDSMKRIDSQVEIIVFTISIDKIVINSKLTQLQETGINSPFTMKKTTDGSAISPASYHFSKYMIHNCGRGSAINLTCRLYKINVESNESNDVPSIPFSVPYGCKFDLGLYFELSKPFKSDYCFQMKYYNIYGDEYVQDVPITIDNSSISVDISHPQKCTKSINI